MNMLSYENTNTLRSIGPLILAPWMLLLLSVLVFTTVSADTTIDSQISYYEKQLLFDGNLNITTSGQLLLEGCDITFTGTIRVESNGSFVIRNSTLHMNREQTVHVLWVEKSGRFEIFLIPESW